VLPFDPGLHRWGRLGGYALALDAQYLYVTMQQSGCGGGDDSLNLNGLRSYPPCAADGTGPVWHAVRRYSLLTLLPVPFSGGVGHDGSMLVVDVEDTGDSRPLTGLAVHQGPSMSAAVSPDR